MFFQRVIFTLGIKEMFFPDDKSQRKEEKIVRFVYLIIVVKIMTLRKKNIMEYLKYTPEVARDWKNATNYAKGYLHKRILDSMNESQLVSKMWLVQELLNLNVKPINISLYHLGGLLSTLSLYFLITLKQLSG